MSQGLQEKPTRRNECALVFLWIVQAFGTILNLVPLAESVVKLTAVCMECFREAAYTKRLGVEKEVATPCLLPGVGRLHLEAGCGGGGSCPLPSPRDG